MAVSLVSATALSGDSTITIANGSQVGRAIIVAAHQDRSPTNLTGFSIDGANGTTVGQQTDSSGTTRTLAVYWGDENLPTTGGSYSLLRLPNSTTGGTSYVVYEFTGVTDITQTEIISAAFTSGGVTDPFNVVFSTSAANDFLGIVYRQDAASGGSLGGGAGQTNDSSDVDHVVTRKIDTSGDQTAIVTTNRTDTTGAYTAFAVKGESGPTLTAPASVSPGASGQFTVTGLTPTTATVSDGTSTLTLTNIALVSGDTYSFDTPALPAVGASLQYTTFGAVTMTVGDGNSTAQDATSLVTSAYPITTLGATFDTGELSWLYNFTPDPAPIEQGDQGTPQTAGITLASDGGYVADTDGTYVITGIDATDGIAQTYELIVGPAAATSGRLTRRNLTRRTLTRRSLTARP